MLDQLVLFFLSCLFIIICFNMTPIDWHLLLASIILSFLATFSKEQGATAFALCALYEVLYNQKACTASH